MVWPVPVRPPPDDSRLAQKMLYLYWPSLALWRGIEMKQLFSLDFQGPIIDVGCGDGTFSHLLFKRVDVGIDISPRLLSKANKLAFYGELRHCYAHSLPYPDESFQTVFSNSVLEHIPNLSETIKELSRVLAPGGQLIITTPTELLESFMLSQKPWYLKIRNTVLCHLHLFSLKEWTELLKVEGLQVIYEHSYLTPKTVRYWDMLDFVMTPHIGRFTPPVLIWKHLPKSLIIRIFLKSFLFHFSSPCTMLGGSRLIIAEKR